MLVPALLGSSPALRPISTVFTQFAWLVAFVFALIAVIRSTAPPEPAESDQPPAPPSTQDNVWIPSVASGVPPRPPRPESWSLDVLDRVEWKRFEDLCCAFYREKGIRAETTRLGADGGIDIHLFQDDTDPNRATAIVQCKAWNKPVGVKEVRELRGVMAHEKVEKAFFMAPNGYTDDARAFATENRITLLDGKLFLAMLQRLPEEASKRLLEFATAGDWTTPTCPSCGDRMTARDSKRGAFWGCVTYPKCHAKLGMRAKPAAAI
ncbi:restriction endonuclease [Aromatoleum aromaticum]|uniref:restriction endonuclease n=1 Tax=Aromatoleum aromaticum TaxID=551760 RepID=UPI0031F4259A